MTARWFGVKTLYRGTPVGRPRNADADFDSKATLVEERIVLVRARSFAAALRKAETESRAYLELGEILRNAYGQRVRWKSLGVAEAYELPQTPGDRAEVYSGTYIVDRTTKDGAVVEAHFGPDEVGVSRRKNFIF